MSYYKKQISLNLIKKESRPKQEIYTIPITQEKDLPKRQASVGSIDWTAVTNQHNTTTIPQKVKKFWMSNLLQLAGFSTLQKVFFEKSKLDKKIQKKSFHLTSLEIDPTQNSSASSLLQRRCLDHQRP